MISMSRYVNITSGVGAGAAVAQRQLILRLVTTNSVLPPGVVGLFDNADDVGSYFGITSEEYKRALAYFAFISKNINSPQQLSFTRWVTAAIAAMIVGDTSPKSLPALKAITAGTLTINSGSTPINMTGIDLSAATDLTNVAALLQTAIRAETDPELTGASVIYNTNTNQFTLTGTTTGSGSLTVTPNPSDPNDLSVLLGWGTTGAVNVPGQAADSADQAIAKSAAINNNFGSFVFCNATPAMGNSDIEAVAAWNAAQNNTYLYSVHTSMANASALYDLVKGFSGTCLNLFDPTKPDDYVEQSPCEILAATDYDAVNSTQNYMFYQFPNRNITVTDDPTANTADSFRLNYIGATQNAGQTLAFYQRGYLCGGSQDATDINTYANEMWMKSNIESNIMQMFLAMPRVPANQIGEGQILGVIQSAIDAAKNNGVISAGKDLTVQQQQFITQISGSATAWRQVSTIGYWVTISISSYVNTNNGLTEWKAHYTLIYSKDDAIRFVDGNDILI